jgi:hypothetical protein
MLRAGGQQWCTHEDLYNKGVSDGASGGSPSNNLPDGDWWRSITLQLLQLRLAGPCAMVLQHVVGRTVSPRSSRGTKAESSAVRGISSQAPSFCPLAGPGIPPLALGSTLCSSGGSRSYPHSQEEL